jgi:hypothetical protein
MDPIGYTRTMEANAMSQHPFSPWVVTRLRAAIRGSIIVSLASFALLSGPPVLAVNGGACASPYDPVVTPSDFTGARGRPNAIDNPLFPLQPGTTYVYDGTKDGLPQHDVFAVTRDRKTIIGVSTVVIRDTVFVDGTLHEDTSDWFAQDDRGNVWYFGEDTKEYDAQGNVISTAGSWEAGVAGAKPGIVMQARPTAGDTYRQEFAAGSAEDMATVLSRSKHVSVAYGSFDDVVQTKEFSCLESGIDHKYYAPGVGLILVVAVSSGDERLELVSVTTGG